MDDFGCDDDIFGCILTFICEECLSCDNISVIMFNVVLFSVQLLCTGLLDPSPAVREITAEHLLPKWNRECQEGNFAALLTRLDVETAPNVSPLSFLFGS